jgi:hypothetical protein
MYIDRFAEYEKYAGDENLEEFKNIPRGLVIKGDNEEVIRIYNERVDKIMTQKKVVEELIKLNIEDEEEKKRVWEEVRYFRLMRWDMLKRIEEIRRKQTRMTC